jgi:hypothetical protein
MRTQEPTYDGFQDDAEADREGDEEGVDASAATVHQPHVGSWVSPILAAEGVQWDPAEITSLERALVGTNERYRVDVLRALINCGYRPTDELFVLVALFGKLAELASEVPEQLSGAKLEFEALVDRSATSVAQHREAFEGFTLSVQRMMEALNERMREQAGNLASDHLSAAIAAKEAELRQQIQYTIGDTIRTALRKGLEENSALIDTVRDATSSGSVVAALVAPAAASAKTVSVPVPLRFVAKGGLVLNGKALLPVFLSAALGLFSGIEIGHHFPPPSSPSIAQQYGQSVIQLRRVMPADVRTWLDEHVHLSH